MARFLSHKHKSFLNCKALNPSHEVQPNLPRPLCSPSPVLVLYALAGLFPAVPWVCRAPFYIAPRLLPFLRGTPPLWLTPLQASRLSRDVTFSPDGLLLLIRVSYLSLGFHSYLQLLDPNTYHTGL